MLQRLIDHGVVTSITAGSLVGQFGAEVQRFTFELVRRGMVHNVASDAHDHLRRAPGIADALEQAGLLDSYEWWAELVPAALLRGESPPPRSSPAS